MIRQYAKLFEYIQIPCTIFSFSAYQE